MNREDLEQDSQIEPFQSREAGLSREQTRSSGSAPPTALQLHYRVAMPEPETHLFEVSLHIQGLQPGAASLLDLKMPVWTPGSYLVREYARHLQNFVAVADDRLTTPLPWCKISKNHWQIDPQGQKALTVRYRIYANELSVRTNHLDSTHGYFNGAALFFYIPGTERQPLTVTIVPPDGWHVSTPLAPLDPSPLEGQSHTFIASDFDTLVDSPFEIGCHAVYAFEALGKPHQLAVWGNGNLEPDRLIQDIQRVIQVEASLFGGLPYDRYLFLLHLSAQGFGGLEHQSSCSLIYQRFGFRQKDKYDRFIQLVTHEFFHLWNIKRIRPKALEVFDYEQENYTPSLWFSEGTTSFYDLVLPYRAGIYDLRAYFIGLNREITRFQMTPGRKVQPLSESSFDAWIKLYRSDANSPNSQMSYYLKGEMVSLLLDLLIRERHGNRRSLDDVMRQMWVRFGKAEVGFTPAQLQQVIETVAETDLTDFFERYLHGTDELPFDDYLNPFGLRLLADGGAEEGVPYLGVVVKTEHGHEVVKFVETASPAEKAGMAVGDELLALNELRVSADHLSDRLRDFQPGERVQLSFFHQDELRSRTVTLAKPRLARFQVMPVKQPSYSQEQSFLGWLGVPLAAIRD